MLCKFGKTFEADISIIKNIYQKYLLAFWCKIIFSKIFLVIKVVLKLSIKNGFFIYQNFDKVALYLIDRLFWFDNYFLFLQNICFIT